MSKRTLVDWRTWLYLKEHSSAELLQLMGGRTPKVDESTPDQLRAAVRDVDRFIILGLKWPLAGYDVPNEYIAEHVKEYAGKAVGFACVHPDEAGAPAEFERCITKLGMRGLSLYPGGQDFDPHAAGAWKLCDMAQEFGVPLVMNQFLNSGYPRTVLDHASPMLVDKIALAFPRLRIVIAHLGNPWFQETVLLVRKHRNVYSDLALLYNKKWQFYNALQIALDYDMAGKLLFGSDSPFQAPASAVQSFKGINDWAQERGLPKIPEAVIDDILYNRPLEMLGI
ncbi:MAG: amidohydrolase family protein [Pseudorhodoplanes sp.]